VEQEHGMLPPQLSETDTPHWLPQLFIGEQQLVW
jgi:hypothetical protein